MLASKKSGMHARDDIARERRLPLPFGGEFSVLVRTPSHNANSNKLECFLFRMTLPGVAQIPTRGAGGAAHGNRLP